MTSPGHLARTLRKEAGITLDDFAQKMGMSGGNWGKKERSEVRMTEEEREAVAAHFGLSLADFDARWKPPPPGRTRGGPGIPVINRASAGQVIDYEEHGTDSGQGFEYLDWGAITENDAFAVIVVGQSMLPMLHPDDYLVLTPRNAYLETKPVPNGSLVLVRFTQEAGGGGCLCRWNKHKDGTIVLTKDNPTFPPRVAKREDIEQLAVAIERRTRRL